MNIMFFSEAAWDDKNSFGNTISNWFCGEIWKNDCYSNFYVRNIKPDNCAEVSYYNLSAIDIVKGIASIKITGRKFNSANIGDIFAGNGISNEKNAIDKIHKRNNQVVYFIHELIWRSKAWISKDFISFVDKEKPDVLFAFATSTYILWPLISFLKKHHNCKVVLFIADDEYSRYNTLKWYRKGYLLRNLDKCMGAADIVYAVSDQMAEKYSGLYKRSIQTLYKGCSFSRTSMGIKNNPLKIVYAGNLLWGRDDTLAALANAISVINKTNIKAVLEIYTGTTLTYEIKQKLNIPHASTIIGSRSYDEIKSIMGNADIVLHVESFDEEQKSIVKYSFSTKIIDCLQSGAQVLGIGPKDIACIGLSKIQNVFTVVKLVL